MKPAALIFDMDGTLADNNPYHVKAWQAFYKKRGRELTLEQYKQNINGKAAKDAFFYIFNQHLTAAEISVLSNEKESLYRELYKPHVLPIEGLLIFLEEVNKAGIPMAVATSGLPVNIDFLFDHIVMRHYFKQVIDASQVRKGKPDPEIFLKAAESVNVNPLHCVAFEDSVAGIKAANAAGMKVVALTTMQKKSQITGADCIIDNYTQINLDDIFQLLD